MDWLGHGVFLFWYIRFAGDFVSFSAFHYRAGFHRSKSKIKDQRRVKIYKHEALLFLYSTINNPSLSIPSIQYMKSSQLVKTETPPKPTRNHCPLETEVGPQIYFGSRPATTKRSAPNCRGLAQKLKISCPDGVETYVAGSSTSTFNPRVWDMRSGPYVATCFVSIFEDCVR